MVEVKFYDDVLEQIIEIVAIVAKHRGNWVLCRAKGRNTYEIPAGHCEQGETILEAARRELYEETGAIKFELEQVGGYSVLGKDNIIENSREKYGMLYYGEIKEFGKLPDFEMEEVRLFKEIPEACTYPLVQPKLIERIERYLENGE